MPPILLPAAVRQIIARLESSGHSAYAVGGCVRDSLLSRTPKDWDLCTDALPQQVLSLFADCRPIPTGLAHGTVTVPLGGALDEITTFRTESGYTDSRHPDRVTFVRSLGQDLARRDFTVNAMAYHPREGLCDPFHGWDDLQNGVLRCVGDPDTRFGEDALRILRGLRFAALYHLTPEPCTESALHRHRQALLQVAPERLLPELTGLLCSPLPGALLETYADILFVLLPELADQLGFPQHNPHHYLDVWHHTLAVVDAVPPLVPLRLAALLHDVAKPSCASVDAAGISHFYGHPAKGARMADAICRRLRCDGALRHRVVRLIELHDERTTPTLPAVRRLMRRTELPVLRQLFLLQRADAAGQAPATRPAKFARIAQVEALVSRVLDEGLCFTTRQLCVNGDDLAAIGVARGPQMGLFLERLLDEVVDERLENNRQALLSQAVRWLASPGENSQKSHK